ncbi:MAG: hypothetical protein J2P57_24645 [Acidimicrobiaceae bacterium]|nr:hypothetical protein [Acidimicrobiaceae bacterium]
MAGPVPLWKRAAGQLLTAFWAWREPPVPAGVAVTSSPTDALQRTMNLVMPLRRPGVVGRGELVQALSEASEALVVGLNNVGTVHFARFDLLGDNLCMFSVYDGDFAAYIRDFVATVGGVFDTVMGFVKDPPPLPVADHVHDFVAWVARHDAFQLPDEGSDLASKLSGLQRAGLVTLYRHRNVQLGAYRAYPGFSVAQIRQHLAVGW